MSLAERARAVRTQEDLVAFIEALRADHAENGEAWIHPDLGSFLEAMGAWARDSDAFYRNIDEDPTALGPWRRMADLLMAARIYE